MSGKSPASPLRGAAVADLESFARLIRYSYSTLTGASASIEVRLKYVELWFSSRLDDGWEVRRDGPQDA